MKGALRHRGFEIVLDHQHKDGISCLYIGLLRIFWCLTPDNYLCIHSGKDTPNKVTKMTMQNGPLPRLLQKLDRTLEQVIHFPWQTCPRMLLVVWPFIFFSLRSAAMPPWTRRFMPWVGAPTESCLTLSNALTPKPNSGRASVLWKREGKNVCCCVLSRTKEKDDLISWRTSRLIFGIFLSCYCLVIFSFCCTHLLYIRFNLSLLYLTLLVFLVHRKWSTAPWSLLHSLRCRFYF